MLGYPPSLFVKGSIDFKILVIAVLVTLAFFLFVIPLRVQRNFHIIIKTFFIWKKWKHIRE